VAPAGLDWLQAHTGVTLAQLQGWLVGGSRKLLETLMSSGGSVLMGAVGTLTSFLLMLFVLFFVLRDGPRLARQLVPMLPIEERSRARLWRHLAEVTRAVFMGIGSPPWRRACWSASASRSPGSLRRWCSAWSRRSSR